MDPDPDRALVAALSSDDPTERRRALSELFERHHRRVFNVAYRVLGSQADAADATQEVFLQVADRIRSFRGDSSLTSWIYRMTVNLAIDARRKRSLRATAPIGPGDEERPDVERAGTRAGVSSAAVDPSAAAEAAERERRVHRALDTLSPKLRAVVVLRYFENLSYEELAEVLQTSIGTVKSRLNRAHAALEGQLGDFAGGGG